MSTVGIIAEYNPFHNGHLYHLQKSKEITNCDTVVAVMSGNFIQRGLPALFDKWTRTAMAIQNGVDLVIELPTFYSISSAEYFANGSISLLDSLGIIDYLSFGSKCNDIHILKRIANVLYLEPEEYKKNLQTELKRGISFPIARSNALKRFLKKEYDEKLLANILLEPNNILGIEYLKAIHYNNSLLNPVVVERTGSDYNSTQVNGNICSATAIREMFKRNHLSELGNVLPNESYQIIQNEITNGKDPITLEHFENEILYELRKLPIEDIANIADVSEGLENIIKKSCNECFDIEHLIDLIKSKRYTKTRIQRIILHILLHITKNDIENYKHNPQYIRILGFSKKGEKLLSKIASTSKLPIVTSTSKFLKSANETQRKMLEKDILATNIYTLGYSIPSFRKNNLDYTANMIEEKN